MRIPVIFLFLFFVLELFSQDIYPYYQDIVPDAQKGYYIKGDTLVSGMYITDENRKYRSQRAVIPQQLSHKSAILYPSIIQEYGFPGQKRYVSYSFEYKDKKYSGFLEEMLKLNNNTFIFCYAGDKEDIFFLLQHNEMKIIDSPAEIGKVWRIIQDESECPNLFESNELPKKLTYTNINKYHLAYRNCHKNVLQSVRYGVTISFGGAKPRDDDDALISYKFTGYTFSYSVGGFVQIPVDELFNFRPEIRYSYMKNDKGAQQSKADLTLKEGWVLYSRQSLQMPLLFQLNMNNIRGKFIPYLEAGLLLDLSLTGIHKQYQELVIEIPTIYGGKSNKRIVQRDVVTFHAGLVAGAGMEYRINRRNSLYAGIRFNYTYGQAISVIESVNYWMLNLAFSL